MSDIDIKVPAALECAPRVTIDRGGQVFRQGDSCRNYFIALQGCIKVFARSPGGKEIVLYRVEPGDICVLTTSCIMANSLYPADAIAETDVTAIALPKVDFERLMHGSEEFRAFVLSSFGSRLSGLITLVEQVALESVGRRLAGLLLERTDERHPTLEATHQEIATEIGSAREVVSRQIKTFEARGWVELARGEVTVLDRAALQESIGEV